MNEQIKLKVQAIVKDLTNSHKQERIDRLIEALTVSVYSSIMDQVADIIGFEEAESMSEVIPYQGFEINDQTKELVGLLFDVAKDKLSTVIDELKQEHINEL